MLKKKDLAQFIMLSAQDIRALPPLSVHVNHNCRHWDDSDRLIAANGPALNRKPPLQTHDTHHPQVPQTSSNRSSSLSVKLPENEHHQEADMRVFRLGHLSLAVVFHCIQ